MKIAISSLFLFYLVSPLLSIEIRCEQQKNFWTPFGSLNECLLRNLTVTEPRSILSVNNQFLNLEETKSFHIYQSPLCFYIPFAIEKHFLNLEVLIVNHSGLRTVTKDDFKPLQHLRGLYLNDNQLETIGSDLFSYNLDIQEINLSDNKIKHVAVGVFDALIMIAKIEMSRNSCIDKSAGSFTEIETLKAELKEKCLPKIVIHQEKAVKKTLNNTDKNLIDRLVSLEEKHEKTLKKLQTILSAFHDICKIIQDD